MMFPKYERNIYCIFIESSSYPTSDSTKISRNSIHVILGLNFLTYVQEKKKQNEHSNRDHTTKSEFFKFMNTRTLDQIIYFSW
jgi:hypothetical protein